MAYISKRPIFVGTGTKSKCRKDNQNSTTLSHSTQHLCSDTFKSNLRHFHSRHQIFGISVNLKIFIFELVMKIVHYNENDIIVYIILNKQQKWIDFTKTDQTLLLFKRCTLLGLWLCHRNDLLGTYLVGKKRYHDESYSCVRFLVNSKVIVSEIYSHVSEWAAKF